MGRWGGGTGLSASAHPPRTTATGDGAANPGNQGQKARREPKRSQEGGKARGNREASGTTPEVAVRRRQRLRSTETTPIRAQNDRNPEALATYGRK